MADTESTRKPKRRICAQSRKNIKRAKWYYREGEYFVNKAAFREWKKKKVQAEAEARAKAAEGAPA